jgi:hypothetical protein
VRAARMGKRGLTLVSIAGAAAALLVSASAAQPQTTRALGDYSVSVTGPDTITTSFCCAPERFNYSISIQYIGAPLTQPTLVTFTDQLPVQVKNAGMEAPTAHLNQCTFSPEGVTAPVVSCVAHFDQSHLTNAFLISSRPTAAAGVGTNTLTLSTGETASWTTTFIHIDEPVPPPPPPPPPPPIPGPAAAPTQTVSETFSQPGEAQKEAVPIAPSAETAQIALTWPDPQASFDVTGIQLVPSGRFLALTEKRKPAKLKITKLRKKRSLDVRIKNLHRGKLKFKIVAKKLADTTRVKAKIRQSKR